MTRPGHADKRVDTAPGVVAIGRGDSMRSVRNALVIASFVFVMIGAVGCQKPTRFGYTGPRVYIIKGSDADHSEGLYRIHEQLRDQEIATEVYSPRDWLRVVRDIDRRPSEEAILVGHGHGAFLCTQVVRHYAQKHKTKLIEAVFSLDARNKDWPEGCCWCCSTCCCDDGKCEAQAASPTAIPVGHNAQKVYNWRQDSSQCPKPGADLVSTRASNVAHTHPYYWYDHYWCGAGVTGQELGTDVTPLMVNHSTIDNERELVERIVRLCHKEALSPYHYTPPEHYVDVQSPPSQTGTLELRRR